MGSGKRKKSASVGSESVEEAAAAAASAGGDDAAEAEASPAASKSALLSPKPASGGSSGDEAAGLNTRAMGRPVASPTGSWILEGEDWAQHFHENYFVKLSDGEYKRTPYTVTRVALLQAELLAMLEKRGVLQDLISEAKARLGEQRDLLADLRQQRDKMTAEKA